MSRPFQVLVMGGEGIGPEITQEAVRVLSAVAEAAGLPLALESFEVGVSAQARCGDPLPPEARAACDRVRREGPGAILFGAVSDEPIGILRKEYDLFANLRPVRRMSALAEISPLKDARAEGMDLLIVRELVSDVYYGRRHRGEDTAGRWASQEMYYHAREVERIVRVGFEQARQRRRKLTLVHKRVVVPEVFDLWFDALAALRGHYLDVEVEDLLVDNMAMQLVLRPATFDVVLAPNLFGDILSDLAAGLVGTIGVMPSASLDGKGFALYEPISGTAPTLERDRANPVGSILSVAMLLRHSLGREALAAAVERATGEVLEQHRTDECWRPGCTRVSTSELGRRIAHRAAERVHAREGET